jgi:hypothetical protein
MGKASTALSKRLHAYVSGGVQGVFFRSYTKVCCAQDYQQAAPAHHLGLFPSSPLHTRMSAAPAHTA